MTGREVSEIIDAFLELCRLIELTIECIMRAFTLYLGNYLLNVGTYLIYFNSAWSDNLVYNLRNLQV